MKDKKKNKSDKSSKGEALQVKRRIAASLKGESPSKRGKRNANSKKTTIRQMAVNKISAVNKLIHDSLEGKVSLHDRLCNDPGDDLNDGRKKRQHLVRWQKFVKHSKLKAKKFRHFLIIPWKNKIVRYALLSSILVAFVALGLLLNELPSPRRLTSKENYSVSTQIFDRHGTLLYEIYADENRTPIDIASLPPHVYQASIAIEDQNFYQHFGFDVIGISRAMWNNFRGESLEGGSTITQQLVKNALLTKERSWQRKFKEAILAIFTEIIYSKEEILEMYLNYISYGGTSVGIESASQSYFGKPARELTIAEAALLAGLPQAPTRYSPFGSDPQRAVDRQKEVLRRMYEDGYISKLQQEAAGAEELEFALSTNDIKAPHFVFFVRDLLYDEYGVETVERGGLRVTTTLDYELHSSAQASLSAEAKKLEPYGVGNAAAIIVKPNTGEILSMIGSKNYFDTANDGQVNVVLAERQPGSSIKPIMYATAMQEKILNPGTILIDMPTCFIATGQKPYCPKNYNGGFSGLATVRQSLGNSLNIPAVKSLRALGIEKFIEQATKMGISTWQDPARYGWSLTLGGGEVKMIELAEAFSVLANQGVRVPLTPILKIEDYKGNVLTTTNIDERKENLEYLTNYEDYQQGDLTRVMDRAPAYLTSHIMQDNQARSAAFGSRSELVIPNQVVSVKTGTTNDLRDNWTVGFTPEYLVMTWVGNNDNSPMNGRVVSGVTGAAPIFNDMMSYILQDQEPMWQEKPPDVASGPVCAHGMPPQAGESCHIRGEELYWENSQPSASAIITKNVWINPETGLPPEYGQEIEGLVLEEHTIVQDPVTDQYCQDCNRAVNEEGKTINEQYKVPEDFSLKNRIKL